MPDVSQVNPTTPATNNGDTFVSPLNGPNKLKQSTVPEYDYTSMKLDGYTDLDISSIAIENAGTAKPVKFEDFFKKNAEKFNGDQNLAKQQYDAINEDYKQFVKTKYQEKAYSDIEGSWKSSIEDMGTEMTRRRLGLTKDEFYHNSIKNAVTDITDKAGYDKRFFNDLFLNETRIMTDQKAADEYGVYFDTLDNKWKSDLKTLISQNESEMLPDSYLKLDYDPVTTQPFWKKVPSTDVSKGNIRSYFGSAEMNKAWYEHAFDNFLNSSIKALPSTVGTTVEAVDDILDLLFYGEDKQTWADDLGHKMQNFSQWRKAPTSQDLLDHYEKGGGSFSNWEAFSASMGSGIGSIAAAMAGGAISKGVGSVAGLSGKALSTFAGRGGKGLMSLMAADGLYQEGRANGVDDMSLAAIFPAAAAATYISESMGMDVLFGGLSGAEVKQAIREGVRKPIAGMGSEAIKNLSNEEKKRLGAQIGKSIVSSVKTLADKTLRSTNKYFAAGSEEFASEWAESYFHEGIKAVSDLSAANKNKRAGNGRFSDENDFFTRMQDHFYDSIDEAAIAFISSAPMAALSEGGDKRLLDSYRQDVVRTSVLTGETNNLKKMVAQMRDTGQLANPALAEDGSFLTHGDEKRSMNDFLYDRFIEEIDMQEKLLTESGLLQAKENLLNSKMFKSREDGDYLVNEVIKGRANLFSKANAMVLSGAKLIDQIAILENRKRLTDEGKASASDTISNEEYEKLKAEYNLELEKIKSGKLFEDNFKQAMVENQYSDLNQYNFKNYSEVSADGQKMTLFLPKDGSTNNINSIANADKLSNYDPLKRSLTLLNDKLKISESELYKSRATAPEVDSFNKSIINNVANTTAALNEFKQNSIAFDLENDAIIDGFVESSKNPKKVKEVLTQFDAIVQKSKDSKTGIKADKIDNLKKSIAQGIEESKNNIGTVFANLDEGTRQIASELGTEFVYDELLNRGGVEQFIQDDNSKELYEGLKAQEELQGKLNNEEKNINRNAIESKIWKRNPSVLNPDVDASIKEQSYLGINYGSEQNPNVVSYEGLIEDFETNGTPDDLAEIEKVYKDLLKKKHLLDINYNYYNRLSDDKSFLQDGVNRVTDGDYKAFKDKLNELHQKLETIYDSIQARSKYEKIKRETDLRSDFHDVTNGHVIHLRDNFFNNIDKFVSGLTEKEAAEIRQKVNDTYNRYLDAKNKADSTYLLAKENMQKKIADPSNFVFNPVEEFTKAKEAYIAFSAIEAEMLAVLNDIIINHEKSAQIYKAVNEWFTNEYQNENGVYSPKGGVDYSYSGYNILIKETVADASTGQEVNYFNKSVIGASAGNSLGSFHFVNFMNKITGPSIVSFYSALNAILADFKYAPSLEQQIAVSEVASWFLRQGHIYDDVAKKTTTDYKGNIVFVPGAAGTGKTTFVARLALSAIHLMSPIKGKVYTIAKSQQNVDKLYSDLDQGTTKNLRKQKLLLDDLISNADSIISEKSDVSVIVLDEATLFGANDNVTDTTINEVLKKFNNAGIKIIALGDPSQMPGNWDLMYPKLWPNSIKTTPLQDIQRSNVYYINKVQRVLRSIINSNIRSKPSSDIVFPTTKYTNKSGVRLRHVSDLDNQIKDFADYVNSPDFNPDETVFIVNTPEEKANVVNKLATHGIDNAKANGLVKTIKQGSDTIQGFEKDVVFANIRKDDFDTANVNFYRALLTAATRAKNKLDLALDTWYPEGAGMINSQAVSDEQFDSDEILKQKESYFEEQKVIRETEIKSINDHLSNQGFRGNNKTNQPSDQDSQQDDGSDPITNLFGPQESYKKPKDPPSPNTKSEPIEKVMNDASEVTVEVNSKKVSGYIWNKSSENFGKGYLTTSSAASIYPIEDLTQNKSINTNQPTSKFKIHSEVKKKVLSEKIPMKLVYHKELELNETETGTPRKFKNVITVEVEDGYRDKLKKDINEVEDSMFVISTAFDIEYDFANTKDNPINTNVPWQVLKAQALQAMPSGLTPTQSNHELFKLGIRYAAANKLNSSNQNSITLVNNITDFNINAGISKYDATKSTLAEFIERENSNAEMYSFPIKGNNTVSVVYLFEGDKRYPGIKVSEPGNYIMYNINITGAGNSSVGFMKIKREWTKEREDQLKNAFKDVLSGAKSNGWGYKSDVNTRIFSFLNQNKYFFTEKKDDGSYYLRKEFSGVVDMTEDNKGTTIRMVNNGKFPDFKSFESYIKGLEKAIMNSINDSKNNTVGSFRTNGSKFIERIDGLLGVSKEKMTFDMNINDLFTSSQYISRPLVNISLGNININDVIENGALSNLSNETTNVTQDENEENNSENSRVHFSFSRQEESDITEEENNIPTETPAESKITIRKWMDMLGGSFYFKKIKQHISTTVLNKTIYSGNIIDSKNNISLPRGILTNYISYRNDAFREMYGKNKVLAIGPDFHQVYSEYKKMMNEAAGNQMMMAMLSNEEMLKSQFNNYELALIYSDKANSVLGVQNMPISEIFRKYENLLVDAKLVAEDGYTLNEKMYVNKDGNSVGIKDITLNDVFDENGNLINNPLFQSYIMYQLGTNPNLYSAVMSSAFTSIKVETIVNGYQDYFMKSSLVFDEKLNTKNEESKIVDEEEKQYEDVHEANNLKSATGDSSIHNSDKLGKNPFDSFSKIIKFIVDTVPNFPYKVKYGRGGIQHYVDKEAVKNNQKVEYVDPAIVFQSIVKTYGSLKNEFAFDSQRVDKEFAKALKNLADSPFVGSEYEREENATIVSSMLYSIYDRLFAIPSLEKNDPATTNGIYTNLSAAFLGDKQNVDKLIDYYVSNGLEAELKKQSGMDINTYREYLYVKSTQQANITAGFFRNFNSIGNKLFTSSEVNNGKVYVKNRVGTEVQAIHTENNNRIKNKIFSVSSDGIGLNPRMESLLFDIAEVRKKQGRNIILERVRMSDISSLDKKIYKLNGNGDIAIDQITNSNDPGYRLRGNVIFIKHHSKGSISSNESAFIKKRKDNDGNISFSFHDDFNDLVKSNYNEAKRLLNNVFKDFGLTVGDKVINTYMFNDTTSKSSEFARKFSESTNTRFKNEISPNGLANLLGNWFDSIYNPEGTKEDVMNVYESSSQSSLEISSPTSHYHANKDLAMLMSFTKGKYSSMFFFDSGSKKIIYKQGNENTFDRTFPNSENKRANEAIANQFNEKIDNSIFISNDGIILNPLLEETNIINEYSAQMDNHEIVSSLSNPITNQSKDYNRWTVHDYVKNFVEGHYINKLLKKINGDINSFGIPITTPADGSVTKVANFTTKSDLNIIMFSKTQDGKLSVKMDYNAIARHISNIGTIKYNTALNSISLIENAIFENTNEPVITEHFNIFKKELMNGNRDIADMKLKDIIQLDLIYTGGNIANSFEQLLINSGTLIKKKDGSYTLGNNFEIFKKSSVWNHEFVKAVSASIVEKRPASENLKAAINNVFSPLIAEYVNVYRDNQIQFSQKLTEMYKNDKLQYEAEVPYFDIVRSYDAIQDKDIDANEDVELNCK